MKKTFKGTYCLALINIVVFAIMTLLGGTTNINNLMRFGALSSPLVKSGEIWRLITSDFIHIGFMHLLMNLFFLLQIGPVLENLYGTRNYLIMYIMSGLMGSLFVFGLGNDSIVSAGASTSLYGMLGAVIGNLVFYRDDKGLMALGIAYLPIVLANIIFSVTNPDVSILGHLGGFAGGFLLSGIVSMKGRTISKNSIKGYSASFLFSIIFVGLFVIGYLF